MSGETTTTTSKNYLPVLDGLRAVSIGLVLVSHLVIYNPDLIAIRHFALSCGATGVSVFFVISGYLITRLLMLEEQRNRRIDLCRFYIRRSLRILPAAYFFLAVVVLLTWMGLLPASPVHSYLAAVFYVRNLVGRGHETSHLWSLSIEEQFYLVWPSLLVLLAARHRLPVVVWIIALVCIWRTVAVLTGRADEGMLYIRTDFRIDTILMGCLLALVNGSEKFELWNRAILARPWMGWMTASGIVGLSIAERHIPSAATVQTTVSAVLICLVINWLIRHESSLPGRCLRQPWMLFFGRLSYSLYLWQQLFLGPVEGPLAEFRKFPLNLGCLLVSAIGSYFLVEKPLVSLKNRRFQPDDQLSQKAVERCGSLLLAGKFMAPLGMDARQIQVTDLTVCKTDAPQQV